MPGIDSCSMAVVNLYKEVETIKNTAFKGKAKSKDYEVLQNKIDNVTKGIAEVKTELSQMAAADLEGKKVQEVLNKQIDALSKTVESLKTRLLPTVFKAVDIDKS